MKKIDLIFFIIFGIFLVLLSSQPMLLMCGLITIYIIYRLFWKSSQPKTIFFGLLLFWLSIIIKLFYGDVYNISFEELSISPNILQTAYIALLALVIFSFGIALQTSKINSITDKIQTDVTKYDFKKVILLYLASILLKTGVGLLSSIGLGEIARALLLLRSGIIFVLIYVYYKKNNSLGIPLLLISIEILLSFFSYFSSFKDIIISVVVAFTYFKIELKVKQLVLIGLISIGCLYLLLIWQAIKTDYREFLSGGKRSQSVVVDRGDALFQFYDLASAASINDQELWYSSIDRLSYIEFFSETTDNVPSTIPHEEGALWKKNILHVLVPRILNKNKQGIYDSEMVNKYATRKVAGADVGVSFSLGWLAESYIDYGYVFMFIPVFLLGLFLGYIYRYIFTESINHLWGCAFVTPLWALFSCNGTPGAKILGWVIVYFIVFLLVNKYVVNYLERFLSVKTVELTPQKLLLTSG